MAGDTISIEGSDFAQLYNGVRKFSPALGKSLRKRLTAAAVPVREDVRRAALSIPAGGGAKDAYRKKRGSAGGDASLRQGIAAATEIKVFPSRPGWFGVRIRVSGTKFAAATGRPLTLPRYMEGLSRRGAWRHPVFGTDTWVTQASHPYLVPTASTHKDAVQKAIKAALQEAVDEVLKAIAHGKKSL